MTALPMHGHGVLVGGWVGGRVGMRLFHICLFACPVAGHWHAVCGSLALRLWGVGRCGVLCVPTAVLARRRVKMRNCGLLKYRISVVDHSSSAHTLCTHAPAAHRTHTPARLSKSGLRPHNSRCCDSCR